MLDSLPLELFRLIVEVTVTLANRLPTYRDGQAAVRLLCLVSRRFRQIAQPLLFEVARIRSKDTLERLLESSRSSSELGSAVRSMVLQDPRKGSWIDNATLEEVVQACPELRSLVVSSHSESKLTHVDSLSRLEHLESLYLSADFLLRPTLLPSLRSLTLYRFHPKHLFDFLDPATLPSLRYLALGPDQVGEVATHPETEPSPLAQLLLQLEVCTVDVIYLAEIEAHHPSIFGPSMSRTLVDAWMDIPVDFSATLSKIVHLRLLRSQMTSPYQLARIAGIIIQLPASAPLRTLYIDSLFSSDPNIRFICGDELRELESECKKRGVEVIYEGQARDPVVDSIVSRDFRGRMKRDVAG